MRRVSHEINLQNERILEVAIQQFCEKGYAKTRMEDIAKVLGITKTPLYYHFKDKAGLFDAAYRKAINEVYSNDIEIFTKNISLYDKLNEAFVACAISFYQLQIGEMSQILMRESDVLSQTVQYAEEVDEMFYKFKTAAMRAAQENGEIKANVDIDEFYSIIIACYSGVLSYVSGMARRKNLSETEKEQMAKDMIGKIFSALKPLYFNEGFS